MQLYFERANYRVTDSHKKKNFRFKLARLNRALFLCPLKLQTVFFFYIQTDKISLIPRFNNNQSGYLIARFVLTAIREDLPFIKYYLR